MSALSSLGFSVSGTGGDTGGGSMEVEISTFSFEDKLSLASTFDSGIFRRRKSSMMNLRSDFVSFIVVLLHTSALMVLH